MIIRSWVNVLIIVLGVVGPARVGVAWEEGPDGRLRDAYRSLLALFPEEAQGKGIDNFKSVVEHQPMTYGLVLSAEAIRSEHEPDEEGRRRIRRAVRWLLDSSDLDGDGKPGWGLPQSWDAFSDGSENPPNTPYTITTAIVLDGLLDALRVPKLWEPAEADEIRAMVRKVHLRWCREFWAERGSDGFFQYSPRPSDAIFSINAPAMYLGTLVRFLRESGDAATEEERRLFQGRMDSLARSIVATVRLRDGCPFWDYNPAPNRLGTQRPNDLVHHAYILWGIERYRDLGGTVELPWTRAQAVASVDRFWAGATFRHYAQDEPGIDDAKRREPPILWDSGMMLAFYAKYGSWAQVDRCFDALVQLHGPMPALRLYPQGFRKGETFYPRQAAHVLFGLAYACFSR